MDLNDLIKKIKKVKRLNRINQWVKNASDSAKFDIDFEILEQLKKESDNESK